MHLLGSLSAGVFLARHWQKQPLFVKQGFTVLSPELSSAELAWLATQPDVESRLVFTDKQDSGTRYRVENGPFAEADLEALPDRDWTLLVQDVDKHLPVFRDLVTAIDFVPDWRVDDLMVSFAAPGGSVGPHSDNYDVFLCQGFGCREWRLTEADNAKPAGNASELRLLKPFAGDPVYNARNGDVLYLPPGVPHWGVASDACMTYSIGMRAPEAGEFRLATERIFPDRARLPAGASRRFYVDPDLGIDESAPGQISVASLMRARQCFRFAADLGEHELARVFGSVATDPKAWLAPDGLPVHTRDELVVHGMARLAWYENVAIKLVFVNGFSRSATKAELRAFQSICEASRNTRFTEDLQGSQDLLQWLLENGVFDLDARPDPG